MKNKIPLACSLPVNLADSQQGADFPHITEWEASYYFSHMKDPNLTPEGFDAEFYPILYEFVPDSGDRTVHFLIGDEWLRRVLPAGLPEEFYSREFHRRTHREVTHELQRLTNSRIHPQAYGCSARKGHVEAFLQLNQWIKEGNPYVFRGDFKECFRHVCLQRLFQRDVTPELLGGRPELFRLTQSLEWLYHDDFLAGTVLRGLPTGLIQGLSPSSHLLNLHLRGFDDFCFEQTPLYLRLHDDFVLAFPDAKSAAECGIRIERYLRKEYPRLSLNSRKSKVFSQNDLQFAGYGYSIKDNQALIRLSRKAEANFKSKYRMFSLDYADNYRLLCSYHDGELEQRRLDDISVLFANRILASQRQLGIVEDLDSIQALWDFISDVFADAFRWRFRTLQQRRKALHSLGIGYGQSQALAKGHLQPVKLSAFSTTKLGQVLLQEDIMKGV